MLYVFSMGCQLRTFTSAWDVEVLSWACTVSPCCCQPHHLSWMSTKSYRWAPQYFTSALVWHRLVRFAFLTRLCTLTPHLLSGLVTWLNSSYTQLLSADQQFHTMEHDRILDTYRCARPRIKPDCHQHGGRLQWPSASSAQTRHRAGASWQMLLLTTVNTNLQCWHITIAGACHRT